MMPDSNQDRARVYAILSSLFRRPEAASLDTLQAGDLSELRTALVRLGAGEEVLRSAEALAASLHGESLPDLQRSYENTFDPAGGPRCAPNETAHTPDSPQEAMTRNFELADIAGFYRAFGVEVTPGSERPDHIAAELEFMHLLAVKELVAGREGVSEERVQICRDAQRAFLRDHLARWSDKLDRRLEEVADGPFYIAAGKLLSRFVGFDAGRLSATGA
jgi:DMSO reductase family type II enzyme chaperone